jgi:hypothetical protein
MCAGSKPIFPLPSNILRDSSFLGVCHPSHRATTRQCDSPCDRCAVSEYGTSTSAAGFSTICCSRGSRVRSWLWLVAEAAWKPRVRFIGRLLERGQLAHSTRFMAKAWCWPDQAPVSARAVPGRPLSESGGLEPIAEHGVWRLIWHVEGLGQVTPRPSTAGFFFMRTPHAANAISVAAP